MWLGMKVKVNIINTWCIIMSKAVTVPIKFDNDFNSFGGITCEGHTDTQTHTDSAVVYIKMCTLLHLLLFNVDTSIWGQTLHWEHVQTSCAVGKLEMPQNKFINKKLFADNWKRIQIKTGQSWAQPVWCSTGPTLSQLVCPEGRKTNYIGLPPFQAVTPEAINSRGRLQWGRLWWVEVHAVFAVGHLCFALLSACACETAGGFEKRGGWDVADEASVHDFVHQGQLVYLAPVTWGLCMELSGQGRSTSCALKAIDCSSCSPLNHLHGVWQILLVGRVPECR